MEKPGTIIPINFPASGEMFKRGWNYGYRSGLQAVFDWLTYETFDQNEMPMAQRIRQKIEEVIEAVSADIEANRQEGGQTWTIR